MPSIDHSRKTLSHWAEICTNTKPPVIIEYSRSLKKSDKKPRGYEKKLVSHTEKMIRLLCNIQLQKYQVGLLSQFNNSAEAWKRRTTVSLDKETGVINAEVILPGKIQEISLNKVFSFKEVRSNDDK